MSLQLFVDMLNHLDAHPPTFKPDPARTKAFLEIGRYLEHNIKHGQLYSMLLKPNPVWQIIEARLTKAMDDILSTDLKRNEVVMWQMYNDGVIIKTGDVVIGLDIVPMPRFYNWDESPGLTENTAGLLDLLLITHEHEDHYDRLLVRECLRQGKPVFMPPRLAETWEQDPNLHRVQDGWKLDIDDLLITARFGFHVWRETMEETPLAYYEIACQEGFTFIFCGDLDYTKRFEKTADREIDTLFIPWRSPNEKYEIGFEKRIGSPLDAVNIAIDRICPNTLILEHYGELNHIFEYQMPASYDLALELQEKAIVPTGLLFWGEKMDLNK